MLGTFFYKYLLISLFRPLLETSLYYSLGSSFATANPNSNNVKSYGYKQAYIIVRIFSDHIG